MCPMEQYIQVAHTRPKPPHVSLLFSYLGFKRAVLGTSILSNGEERFGPTDRNDQTRQGTTFKAGPKYSGLTELKWSVPFDF